MPDRLRWVSWFARIAVGAVFVWNIQCAFVFIFFPERYVSGFELAGISGMAAVQALGILFLMWNVTYPPVILNPVQERTLFKIVLVQQIIGLAGELWLWSTLPPSCEALPVTIARFVLFDAIGLVLIAGAYVLVRLSEVHRDSGEALRGDV